MSKELPAKSVLVVCLGNICRSPMGEAVLRHEAEKLGLPLTVDSAGTSNWEVGSDPDYRTVEICDKYGVPISHIARQVRRKDFTDFDFILGADNQNVRDIHRVAPSGSKAHIALLGYYGDGEAIPDPWYGDIDGFEDCYQKCLLACRGLIKTIYGDDIYDTAEPKT